MSAQSPVCIAGMHRSGTSMAARLLHACGLDLGPEEGLVPATADNPDGHWENARIVGINDLLLNELGGGWDQPPALPAGWLERPNVEALREQAAAVFAQLGTREPWGWKDPRASLVMPFWLGLRADFKVVICVRNPLEVALSLRRRGLLSYSLGLSLWQSYNARLLETTRPAQRIITHYDSFFSRPQAELRRLAEFLELPVSGKLLDECAATIKPALRHSRFTLQHLLDADLSPDLLDLYAEMRAAAGASESDRFSAGGTRREPAAGSERLVDIAAVDAELLRRQVRTAQAALADRGKKIAELEQHGASAKRAIEEAVGLRAELARLTERLADCEAERRALQQTTAGLAAHFAALTARMDETAARSGEIADLARETRDRVAGEQLCRRLGKTIRAVTPPGAKVLVVSRGDDDLVEIEGRVGWHFPQDSDGAYAGHYPADAVEAIAHLEALRAKGAAFLAIPAPALWWLGHYAEFADHLRQRYREVASSEDWGRIFDLR